MTGRGRADTHTRAKSISPQLGGGAQRQHGELSWGSSCPWFTLLHTQREPPRTVSCCPNSQHEPINSKGHRAILPMNRSWPRPFSPGFKPPCTAPPHLCALLYRVEHHGTTAVGPVKKLSPEAPRLTPGLLADL